MAFCPLVVTVVLLHREDVRGPVRRLLCSSTDPRGVRPRTWFLPILLLVPAVTGLAAGVGWLGGRPQPLPDAAYLLVAVPTVAAVGLFSAIGEEAGWTGCLQGVLQRRWDALGAAVPAALPAVRDRRRWQGQRPGAPAVSRRTPAAPPCR